VVAIEKLSVICCTYNAERFIEQTIKSVLNQTYKEFEFLILDNNSKDKTKEIIKKHKQIKLFESKKNLGAYDGLNFLIEKSKGKYIAIIDHDDLWHPKKLELQTNELKIKKINACGTAQLIFYEKWNKFLVQKRKKTDIHTWHSSFLFKKKTLRYESNKLPAVDWDFMERYTKKYGKIYNLKEPLIIHRIRNDKNNYSTKLSKKGIIKKITKGKLKKRLYWLIIFLIGKNKYDYFLINIRKKKQILTKKDLKKSEFLKEYVRYL
jgi:glycosyltransferase involved in cell wall biosynthesis